MEIFESKKRHFTLTIIYEYFNYLSNVLYLLVYSNNAIITGNNKNRHPPCNNNVDSFSTPDFPKDFFPSLIYSFILPDPILKSLLKI